jgi:hypothetical protein
MDLPQKRPFKRPRDVFTYTSFPYGCDSIMTAGTADFPFNTDSDETRYQELFRERARQELEDLFPPPAAPDFTKGIDDPDII